MSDTTPARDQVLNTLRDEQPDVGLTAREIEDATGVKYSTVTEVLRALAGDGLVTKEKSGRQVTWTAVATDSMESVMAGSLDPDEAASERRAASGTGARVVDEVAGPSGPVPVREDPEPSETAVDASEALAVPATPGDRDSAVTGEVAAPVGPTAAVTPGSSVADVAAFMESQRPIPDAPAVPAKRTRTPRTPAEPRDVRNDFGSGGLQTAMLTWMDEQPRNDDGTYADYTPTVLAKALSAHTSSVAYSFKQTTKKGQTVRTTAEGVPPRYRLVTADESAAAAGA